MAKAVIFALLWVILTSPAHAQSPCFPLEHDTRTYTACTLSLSEFDISLHWQAPDGVLIGHPTRLHTMLNEAAKDVALITNGGMYHADRTPVGLFVEEGIEQTPLVRGEGPGNFQLLPNGVFFLDEGVARILETEAFAEAGAAPDLATQSGPMLVIDGALHPAFRKASESVYRRSGVGVSDDGQTVWIVISEEPVNFFSFASVFRDGLGLDNALYLDGKVSRLDVPGDARREFGLAMGPILAATHKPKVEDAPE
ncbi:MAG: phosphodiester glycosidase family protein [Pseudomonadota bacterium]